MSFGSTAGNVGQQGSKTGNVAVGSKLNKGKNLSFVSSAVALARTKTGNVAIGNQLNKGQQFSLRGSNTGGNIVTGSQLNNGQQFN